ncbi:MAG TPA: cold shock domain-containing protein, partial [Ignavibacteriales bacterium]|nr:cold shock domain-containing protein [Ignavibacteriales bacterium]
MVIGDQVEFKIEPSKKKEGSFQACEIILVKKGNKDQIQTNQNYLLGKVKWFDKTKGYGFISTDDNKDYFIHKTNLLSTTYIEEGDIVVFCEKIHNGKFNAIKCQPFLASLNKFSSEIQSKLLNKYLLKLGSINVWNYAKIRSIAQSDKIEEKVKEDFLKLAFEKASTEYQCQMLADGIIILSAESQKELLNKYLLKLGSINYLTYDNIKSIAQSDKIEEKVKEDFLKSAYEKASSEYQGKMLIDGLIVLSPEGQIEVLNKYLLELDSIKYSTYDKIKSIAHSDKIEEKVKEDFLKSAFEKAGPEYQYEMLFEDKLIDLQKETLESQIELLNKYLLELDSINYSTYDEIKSIAESDKIEEKVKEDFLKLTFAKASSEYQYKMLFEDKLIDLQNETPESQKELLEKFGSLTYEQIKSISELDWLEPKVKDAFLKSAFGKAYSEYQYKMLFEDKLIDLQNETS